MIDTGYLSDPHRPKSVSGQRFVDVYSRLGAAVRSRRGDGPQPTLRQRSTPHIKDVNHPRCSILARGQTVCATVVMALYAQAIVPSTMCWRLER